MQCPESHSIASGLSPPFAGKNAFNHIRKFVRGIILIKEDEIKATVSSAFKRGVVIEPAGAAALAAVLTGKVTNVNTNQHLYNKYFMHIKIYLNSKLAIV